MLHGSQNQSVGEVVPRQADDVKTFSNQRAIYATTDGIWVIYFAILDRAKYPMSLFNSCLRTRVSGGELSDPPYFFSITHSALLQEPWCEGMIYILPRQDFEQEAPQQVQGMEIILPHWISTSPAKPIAKLPVGNQDFPFLAQVHGHNDEKLAELATADPSGFPWPEALESQQLPYRCSHQSGRSDRSPIHRTGSPAIPQMGGMNRESSRTRIRLGVPRQGVRSHRRPRFCQEDLPKTACLSVSRAHPRTRCLPSI